MTARPSDTAIGWVLALFKVPALPMHQEETVGIGLVHENRSLELLLEIVSHDPETGQLHPAAL